MSVSPLLSAATSPETSCSFFDTDFSTRYQRNNKKHSLKNLRCFPSCGFRHKERGFCGRSVLVKVSIPFNSDIIATSSQTQNLADRIFCFAEFLAFDPDPSAAEGTSNCDDFDKLAKPKNKDFLPIKPSAIVDLKQALLRSRNKSKPLLPWLMGEKISVNEVSLEGGLTEVVPDKNANLNRHLEIVFEFNKQRRGWHYGWQSNKHTCDTLHAFRVYSFILLDDNEKQLFLKHNLVSNPNGFFNCDNINPAPGEDTGEGDADDDEDDDDLETDGPGGAKADELAALGKVISTFEKEEYFTSNFDLKPSTIPISRNSPAESLGITSHISSKPRVINYYQIPVPNACNTPRYFMEPLQELDTLSKTLFCVNVVESVKFMLFCRRRRRFVMEPSAPSSMPIKRLKYESSTGMSVGVATTRNKLQRLNTLNSLNQNDDDAIESDYTLYGDAEEVQAAANGQLPSDSKIDRLLKTLFITMKRLKTNPNRKMSFTFNSPLSVPEPLRTERDFMIEDLAKYLLNDKTFGQELARFFFDAKKQKAESLDGRLGSNKGWQENYAKFLRVVKRQFRTYRGLRNISLSEFEIFFSQPVQPPTEALQHSGLRISSATPFNQYDLNNPHGSFIKTEADFFDGLLDNLNVKLEDSFENVARNVSSNIDFSYDPSAFAKASSNLELPRNHSLESFDFGLGSHFDQLAKSRKSSASGTIDSNFMDAELNNLIKETGLLNKTNNLSFDLNLNSSLNSHNQTTPSRSGSSLSTGFGFFTTLASAPVEIPPTISVNTMPNLSNLDDINFSNSFSDDLTPDFHFPTELKKSSRFASKEDLLKARFEDFNDFEKVDEFLNSNFDEM